MQIMVTPTIKNANGKVDHPKEQAIIQEGMKARQAGKKLRKCGYQRSKTSGSTRRERKLWRLGWMRGNA